MRCYSIITVMVSACIYAGPVAAQVNTPDRLRVVVVERTAAGGSLTAKLTATRSKHTTSWSLECMDNGDRSAHPPKVAFYKGTSAAEERWVEGTYRDEYQNSKFTLAVGQPQLWMANLRGCPRVGQPRIQRLPMQ